MDAIFPPVSCSDIISKQYGLYLVRGQTSRFANVSLRQFRENVVVRRLQACYIYLSIRLHHAFLFKYNYNNKYLRTCNDVNTRDNLLLEACEYA